MKNLKVFIFGALILLLSFSQAQAACVAEQLARVDFNPKDGNELVIYIEDGETGQKQSEYRYKSDFDGSLKLSAIALAAKNADDQQLKSLKGDLIKALAKYIYYWDHPSRNKKTSKAIKESVVEAKSLLGSLKENKLTKKDLDWMSMTVLSRVNEDRSLVSAQRHLSILAFDQEGNADNDSLITGRAKSLEGQLPKGFFASIMSGKSNAQDGESCGERSFAAEIIRKPGFSHRVAEHNGLNEGLAIAVRARTEGAASELPAHTEGTTSDDAESVE